MPAASEDLGERHLASLVASGKRAPAERPAVRRQARPVRPGRADLAVPEAREQSEAAAVPWPDQTEPPAVLRTPVPWMPPPTRARPPNRRERPVLPTLNALWVTA